MTHIPETDLALYVSADLRWLRRIAVSFHLHQCERCRARVVAYRAHRDEIRRVAQEMPEGLNWDRLAAEMTANIRVGLAAGECVARRPQRSRMRVNWRPAAIAAGVIALLTTGWWLNMPTGTTEELGRAMTAVWHGRGSVTTIGNHDREPVVVATPLGIELRENDNAFGGSQDSAPLAVSVSMQGSASARYVAADTGQMTITSVYVQ